MGIARTFGTSFTSKTAVKTDASAMTAFTKPESQYAGVHSVQISIM